MEICQFLQEYKRKQETAEKQLQQVLFNNKNGNNSNQVCSLGNFFYVSTLIVCWENIPTTNFDFQVIAEELEVEPLTYCVKDEPEDDEDENSNFMGSEECSDDGTSEQNIVADVDPPADVMEEDDSDDESLPNQQMMGQEFEPVWMNNGNEENENGENSSQWVCQYCNSSFPNEEKFNRHSLIHTSVILRIFFFTNEK